MIYVANAAMDAWVPASRAMWWRFRTPIASPLGGDAEPEREDALVELRDDQVEDHGLAKLQGTGPLLADSKMDSPSA